MTDFELNKAIAEALGWELKPVFFPLVKENKTDKVFLCIKEDGSVPSAFDFNNWNDLMPLVVEYAQDIDFETPCDESFDVFSRENPQRALAECLLKVFLSSHT